jgi:hypothetical protein
MVEFRSGDESERNKKREPEAKRQHDRRARPVNIANGEPQRHAPLVREFFRARHDQKRGRAQQNKGGKRRAQIDQDESPVRGKNENRRSKAESHGKRQDEIARPRSGPPGFDSGAQGLNRHVVCTAERAPAITVRRVDLPEPEGPMRAAVSPRPILSEIPLRIWTLAAPRPRLRCTSSSSTAGSSIHALRNRTRNRLAQSDVTVKTWRRWPSPRFPAIIGGLLLEAPPLELGANDMLRGVNPE